MQKRKVTYYLRPIDLHLAQKATSLLMFIKTI